MHPPSIAHVDVSGPLDADLQALSGRFTLDLAPKVLFCQGPFMQQLLAAGVHNYLEFKLLGARYASPFFQRRARPSSQLWSASAMVPVPASRADVFQSKHLSLESKRQLMRFLKAAAATDDDNPQLEVEFAC